MVFLRDVFDDEVDVFDAILVTFRLICVCEDGDHVFAFFTNEIEIAYDAGCEVEAVDGSFIPDDVGDVACGVAVRRS